MPSVKATVIILARAGSKGLPGKNAMDIAGKPCIAWTIEAAQAAACAGRVVVSADGPELAEIALKWGADVHHRPAELASDTATVDAAARSCLAWLDAQSGAGEQVSAGQPLVLLYANVPVRPAKLIDRAVELLISSGADSVQSYQPSGKHHPFWTARVSADGDVSPWQGDVLNHNIFRRQDLPPAYVPDGGIIAVTRAALTLTRGAPPGPHAFFGVKRRGVINPTGSVVDIDDRIDAIVAAAVLNERLACVGA